MEKQAFMARFAARMKEEREEIQRKMQAYQAQECADDAMLEKIRLNICEALAAAVNAGSRMETLDEALAFGEKKLKEIPAQWQKNMEAAHLHGDEKLRVIEAIKLDQAGRIRAIFQCCREEKA